jgi:spore coat polysaccharide biosynthesis protein SpsF
MHFKIFIQARLSSTRLPGKALYPVGGKPLIIYLLTQLERIINKDDIFVLIGNEKSDLALKYVIENNNFNCLVYDIPEDDVLTRFVKGAKDVGALHIVRLTGDNPFMDLEFLKSSMNVFSLSNKEFATTRELLGDEIKRYAPKGLSIDIFSIDALMRASNVANTKYDREHVIPRMFDESYQILYYHGDLDFNTNYSVDEAEDYIRLLEDRMNPLNTKPR